MALRLGRHCLARNSARLRVVLRISPDATTQRAVGAGFASPDGGAQFADGCAEPGQPEPAHQRPHRLRMILTKHPRARCVRNSAIPILEDPVQCQQADHAVKRANVGSGCRGKRCDGLRDIVQGVCNAEIGDGVQRARGNSRRTAAAARLAGCSWSWDAHATAPSGPARAPVPGRSGRVWRCILAAHDVARRRSLEACATE